jgi:hypothetical protein
MPMGPNGQLVRLNPFGAQQAHIRVVLRRLLRHLPARTVLAFGHRLSDLDGAVEGDRIRAVGHSGSSLVLAYEAVGSKDEGAMRRGASSEPA